MFKLFGGELECPGDDLNIAFTDSGRSSLRLLLNSGFKHKKILLPDFLCDVISETLSECGVLFDYYTIGKDLAPDIDTIQSKKFDVFYAINYFGMVHDWSKFLPSPETILIEDNSFLPFFGRNESVEKWIGFNSFRKISPAADGSLLLSSIPLFPEMVQPKQSTFSELKYKGKNLKSNYLSEGRGNEQDYLSLFAKGERLLDQQKDIFRMSDRSLWHVMAMIQRLHLEYDVRQENFMRLSQLLEKFAIKISPRFPSFLPLLVPDRDGLRNYLRSKKIFLPIHWPSPADTDNEIYESILSVPVDSRYCLEDMYKVADFILNYYE